MRRGARTLACRADTRVGAWEAEAWTCHHVETLCKLSLLLLAFVSLAAAQVFPGVDWERVEKAESAGYSTEKLNALRAWLKAGNTTAMMVSVGGKSLFEYGVSSL